MQYARLIPLALALTLRTGVLFSEPEGFHLRAGEAPLPTHTCEGALLIESGKNASIDWDSFSISPGEIVRFQQQDAMSAVLNRVIGPLPSSLFGTLESNGAVYLVNPNGILIGSEAHILTAGFIASTLDLSGEHFAEKAFAGESNASVVNYGKIVSSAGDVFLIAKRVENHGEIAAQEGRVGLLSGWDVLIRGEKAPEVRIQSEALLSQEAIEENPYALAICQSGKVRAKEVYLEAGAGKTEMSGNIEAPGGIVHVLGDVVAILDSAKIDVSEEKGCGEILVGGDFQGNNPEVKNAKRAFVSKGGSLLANAYLEGDGGKVIVWGDEATFFYGTIEAKGGETRGDGGNAEVSGSYLDFQGLAVLSAKQGKPGVLLLDPTDITISTGGNSNITYEGACGLETYCATAAGVAVLNTTTLNTQLGLSNVTVITTGSGGVGTITVSNAITWSAATKFTLMAERNIVINAAISSTNAGGVFDAMEFMATGGTAANYIGLETFAMISSVDGNISITATGGNTGNVNMGVRFNGVSASSGVTITGEGSLTVVGNGGTAGNFSYGIDVAGANGLVRTTNGNLELTGTGNSSGSTPAGVVLESTGIVRTTGTGNITVSGSGVGSGTSFKGVQLVSAGKIQSQGSGNIEVTGIAPASSGTLCHGINITGSNSVVEATTGTITMEGTGGGLGTGIGIFMQSSGAVRTTSGTTGTIRLTGSSSGAGSSKDGVNIQTGALVSTPGGADIILTGTCSSGANSAVSAGIYFGGGSVTSAGGGNVTLTGQAPTTLAVGVGALLDGTNAIGTTGTVSFLNCTGGAFAGSRGVLIGATFTSAGPIIGTGIQVGMGSGNIAFASAVVTTTGTNSPISITAISNGNAGASHGISITSTMSTTGGGSITLDGTGGPSTTASHGINISGTGLVTTITTGSGAIDLTGAARGSSSANVGINIAGSTNSVTSPRNGTISLHGTSTGTGAGSHGVSINTSTWTPGTTALVTFSNCSGGGSAVGSHGVNFSSAFTAAGAVTFSTCAGGSGGSNGINNAAAFSAAGAVTATTAITGDGPGGVGFASSQNFTTSSGAIAITATANGTTGACHGISLTGGSLSTTGGGSLTLIGAGGASTTAASHGINLTGGAATVSTATGNGAISLTGTASGNQASFGINIAGSAAGVINSTSGTITVSGTSSSTGAGSHGVSVAAAWTPATSQTVTFSNCQGGGTGASHGVNLGAAFTGAGAVTFSTCTGGAGGGNGINNTAAAFSTTGAVTATTAITGNGSGGVGFASSQNFTSTAGTIAITATANGTAGACHGISLTGGSLSTTGGGSLTLNGTGGASTTAASHGINIASGASTITTTTGNGAISLTGAASGSQTSFGVNIAGTVVGVVTSGSGTITVDGSSSATGADSYGVLVGGTSGWTPATSSLVSITGTGTGLVAQGVNVSQPLINTGAISITGSSSLFGNSFGANVSTSGGAITVTGSSILAATPIVFNTTVLGSANITFSGSTSTIDATSSGSQALTLTAGATGTVTLDGNVGATTPLGAVTISSGALGLSIGTGVTTIDAASFTVAGTVGTTLNNSALLTIDTSAFVGGNIAFGGTITGGGLAGANPLTLITDGAGTITLSGNVGATRLGALIIGAGSGGLTIDTGVTSIAANSFTVAGTVETTLNNAGTLLIDTSGFAGGSIAFGGEITGGTLGTNPLTLTANGLGTVTLSNDVGATTRLGAFTIGAGGGGLVVGTGVTTIAANSFTVAGVVPTTLNNTSALTIDTSGLPGAIAFGGSVTGASGQNLELDPGISNITLSGAVSLGAGGLTFANATNSTASDTITAAFLTQPAGLGTSSFQGITLSGDMSITTSAITLNGAIGAGNVTLANAGLLTIGSAADMTLTGNFDQTGIGAVRTAGDITTDGGNISFISAADLTGTISLTTGGATGTVTLATVNATALLGSHGLTVLGHDVVFNGAVGIGTPLLNLSATGATIELHGNQAVSAGPMTYIGVVHLEDNIFLNNSGAGTVSFLQLAPDPSMVGVTFDSVLGNFDLTITADSAEVLFEGDINLAGVDSGSPTAGGDLEVAGGLGITLEGQVLVQGGSHTGVGAGMNGGNVGLTSSNGTISLHNINTSGGDGSSAGGGGGNITLQPSSALSGGYPVGLIVINADLAAVGNLVSMGGTGTSSGLGGVITLSANRSAQPTVATIASSAAGNDITTESLILTIGAHEAITAIGDLSLNAIVITIGDAVALGNLEIVSGLANLHTHGDVDLLDYLGNLYISPTAHFFAGGTYSQSGTLTPSGPLDFGGGVALTADLLLFDGHVLNFDTEQIPIPVPPGPEIDVNGQINRVYRLGIADAEFFDDLPILRDFPAKPFWIRRVATLRGEPQSIEKLQKENEKLREELKQLKEK